MAQAPLAPGQFVGHAAQGVDQAALEVGLSPLLHHGLGQGTRHHPQAGVGVGPAAKTPELGHVVDFVDQQLLQHRLEWAGGVGHHPQVEAGGTVFGGNAMEPVAVEVGAGVAAGLIGPRPVGIEGGALPREAMVNGGQGGRMALFFEFPQARRDHLAQGIDGAPHKLSHGRIKMLQVLAAGLGVAANGGFGIDAAQHNGAVDLDRHAADLVWADHSPGDPAPGARLGMVELVGQVGDAIAQVIHRHIPLDQGGNPPLHLASAQISLPGARQVMPWGEGSRGECGRGECDRSHI